MCGTAVKAPTFLLPLLQAALNCSCRSDRVAEGGAMALKSAANQLESGYPSGATLRLRVRAVESETATTCDVLRSSEAFYWFIQQAGGNL